MQALVRQVTGLGPEGDVDEDDDRDERYRNAVDFVSKNLEFATKGGASQDMSSMDKQFHGCESPSIYS